jgi:hypothetical protein
MRAQPPPPVELTTQDRAVEEGRLSAGAASGAGYERGDGFGLVSFGFQFVGAGTVPADTVPATPLGKGYRVPLGNGAGAPDGGG